MRSKPRPYPMVECNRNCHLFGKYDPVNNKIIFGCRNDSRGRRDRNAHSRRSALGDVHVHGRRGTYRTVEGYAGLLSGFKKFTNWIPEGLALSVEKEIIERMGAP